MLNYIIYRIGQFIALSLPLAAAYKVAAFFSHLHYISHGKERRAVKENLKIIFPDKTEGQIHKIKRGMFRNFAKYLVDFFRFSILDRDYIKINVKLENMHYIDEALAKNKGVIILTAHLGNWELGAVVIALLGYPLWVVALPHKHKYVDNFFNAQRQSKGVKVIPLGKAVRACLNALAKNEIVALAGDRDFTERGTIIDFFGKPTFFPEGAAAFSLKTGAPIVPGFMLREKGDTFTLRMEKPIEFTPTHNKAKDIVDLIRQYKIIIEDYIRQYPGQWYMFRRFWVS